MVLIAQIWIKHHPKTSVQLCWFNWSIIKVYNWAQWGSFLPAKYNFLGSGLKFIFHWKAQLLIFSKIARGNINIMNYQKQTSVISKQFTFVFWASNGSLIYIKNSKRPRINLWGTPARASAQDEHWPFKPIICFLLQRESRKMLMMSPLISFWRSKVRPWCHTFSKAFEISRVSSPLSNAFKILWLIERSWLMQESPDLDPYWFGERRVF